MLQKAAALKICYMSHNPHHDYESFGCLSMSVTTVVGKTVLLLVLSFVIVFLVVAAKFMPSTIFADHGFPLTTAVLSGNRYHVFLTSHVIQ